MLVSTLLAYVAAAPALALSRSTGDPVTATASSNSTRMRTSAPAPCGPAPAPDVMEATAGATVSTTMALLPESEFAWPGAGSLVNASIPAAFVMLAPPGFSAPLHPYPRSEDSSPARAV